MLLALVQAHILHRQIKYW